MRDDVRRVEPQFNTSFIVCNLTQGPPPPPAHLFKTRRLTPSKAVTEIISTKEKFGTMIVDQESEYLF